MNIELEYQAETLEKAKKYLDNRILDVRYENKVIALNEWYKTIQATASSLYDLDPRQESKVKA
jgi:hypothetical protein